MTLDHRIHPLVLVCLAEEALAHPFERKLLLCRLHGEGRELLRALARAGVGWAGFEVMTPGELATQLVAPALASEGLGAADELDQRALIDGAIDATLTASAHLRLREMVELAGFRDAVWNSVQALRLAGIEPPDLERSVRADRVGKRDFLAGVLRRYVDGLAARSLVDSAEILRRAAALVRQGARGFFSARFYLFPGLTLRGRTGAFVQALVESGAALLEADAAVALPPPHAALWRKGPPGSALAYLHAVDSLPEPGGGTVLDLFCAATPADELREALRRTLTAGVAWDDVEIIATDAAAYGAALEELGLRLGISCTFGVGLPLERSRHGRAVAAYFRWLQEEFPAAVLRQLIETEAILPTDGATRVSGASLARRLRRLQIGWGRERYRQVVEARLLELHLPPSPEDERTDEEREEAHAVERRELELLRGLLSSVLAAAPPVPDRAGTRTARVSPARIAEGLLAFLRFVPAEGEAERAIREHLLEQLERVRATLTREAPFGQALSALRRGLEVRITPPGPEGEEASRLSAGGSLHLTDLDHGGFTGRRHTFIVGLDANRFPGSGIEDPLLLDREREALNRRAGTRGEAGPAPALPTAGELLAERHHRFAALMSRLRGSVTLSYSSWDSGQGRSVPPAPVLLQALRLIHRDPTLSYRKLHEALGGPACAVPDGPPDGPGHLDAADVWLGALDADGILRSGARVADEAFAPLARGRRAIRRWEEARFSAQQGKLQPRRELLDPRARPEVSISASALERLGRCALRYLYRDVLRVLPPDEPLPALGAWLDHLARGRVLHAVFERSLEAARSRGIPYDAHAFRELAAEILDLELDRTAETRPAPSPAVYARERQALKDDVGTFAAMVRRLGAPWIELELQFGRRAAGEPPVEIAVPGGVIRLTGRIDRVDRLPDGKLRVIDYKSGRPYEFIAANRVFHGGRRLQHLLYSLAAEALLGAPVEWAEYHFPTRRAAHDRFAFRAARLRAGIEIVGHLLDLVARGHFPPTEESDDCKNCDFNEACRVRKLEWDLDSPPADWTDKTFAEFPEYAPLRAVREAEGQKRRRRR
ncbi:MAG: PD-(D/E)XK nuclease family protein [Gemmatimonadetes bacterium]|nr:PD-(D/E)XK nuclease family protein [Gemmatimonadota bacterium]